MPEDGRATPATSITDYYSATQLRSDRWSALRETNVEMTPEPTGVHRLKFAEPFNLVGSFWTAGNGISSRLFGFCQHCSPKCRERSRPHLQSVRPWAFFRTSRGTRQAVE